MGLFDKKFCDVCGEKIGLLGNRKLEDGNLCKDCARKLSPFFSDRRRSTVDDIKQQLAYREENKTKLPSFHPTKTYGFSDKVYVDISGRKFIVTSDNNWRDANPDIIDFSQVTGVNTDIEEDRDEVFYEDNEGNSRSYNPPRYKYEYRFNVTINVDSPWFSEIEFELSKYDQRPDSRFSPLYRDLEMMSQELVAVLTGAQMPGGYVQPAQNMYQQGNFSAPQQMGANGPYNPAAMPPSGNPNYFTQSPQNTGNPSMGLYDTDYVQRVAAQQTAPVQAGGTTWICGGCGAQNTGRFCQNCGTPQPAHQQNGGVVRCDKCGWMSQPGTQPPRFCPQCGDPIDFRDM